MKIDLMKQRFDITPLIVAIEHPLKSLVTPSSLQILQSHYLFSYLLIKYPGQYL